MVKATSLTALEQQALERSRIALQKTVVGRRLVAMEPRKAGDAKLTLDDGTVVLLRGDGSCCAFGTIKSLSDVISGDHIITRVESTAGGELWSIYADSTAVGNIGVTADEGNGHYGFGITIEVSTADYSFELVHNASRPQE